MNRAAAVPATPRPRSRRRGRVGGWSIAIWLLALLIAAPILVVLASLLTPQGETWQHLSSTVLPRYVRNSLWLALGVGAGTALLGTAAAWLVTMCSFPGRRLLEWALLLPMAIPAYILAYTYTDFLQFSGPLQSALRTATGWQAGAYWFPHIRSLGGAIFILTLAFYPYVYLLARAAFLSQSLSMLEASLCLCAGPWQSFRRVSLPLARPAIMAGVALALMETLSDFGTVEYFGIQTFTTGIYRTWFGLGERAAAVQLAAWLLLAVLLLLALERRSRRALLLPGNEAARLRPLRTYGLRGWAAALALTLCMTPVALGFALPALRLAYLALASGGGLSSNLWGYAAHSLILGAVATAVATAVAVALAYGVRVERSWTNRVLARIAAMGYAVPGSVIAVSVVISFGWLDGLINRGASQLFGITPGLLLSGSIAGLVFAYLVRFLTTAFNTVETGLAQIAPSMDEAGASLGHRSLSRLGRIHLPLLRGSLLTAALLVFADVIKELPATLIVRPFNFDTLAVRVYRLASDERLLEASGGALLIVLAGLVPVLLLSRAIAASRARR